MTRAFLLLVVALGPAMASALPPAASRPAGDMGLGPPIPRQALVAMYRRELGDLFRADQADRLYQAHELIEQYFAATSSAERKTLVGRVEALQIDANALGRIARLRMNWPELEPGVYYINEKVGPHHVMYFVGIPKGYDRTRPWPLLVKLPAAHAFLTDPPPVGDRVAEIYAGWLRQDMEKHAGLVIVMPLLDLTDLWGPSLIGMNHAIQPMLHVAGRANIDPARVYLSGHSMSGHAAWNLGLHYPTYFAAINPLAGGASADWQRLRVINLRNVLPVVWHDADDGVVKVEPTRDLVRVLRARKVEVVYDETRGVGHAPSDAVIERAFARLRATTRPLYPREVAIQSNKPDTMFNRIDWVQVYQMMRTGNEKRLLLQRGTGRMVLYEHTFTITATNSQANRIDIQCDNVESLRIYLNEQMVDFSRPVTVAFNRKPRFEGMVKPSVEEMLKDQVFLGRGWRYFTGVIDIDLAPPRTTRPTTRGRIEVGPWEP